MTIDVVPAPRRARRVPAVAAVLAVVVALSVVSWVVARGGIAGASGSTCPGSQRALNQVPVVPAPPSVGSFGPGLVPDRVPDSVLLCEYGGGSARRDEDLTRVAVPLARHARVSGDGAPGADLVARILAAPVEVPTAGICTGIMNPSVAPYLVALRYDDGTVWLSTQQTCAYATSNGVAVSSTDLTGDVAAALDRATGVAVPTDPSPVPTPVASTFTPPPPLWFTPCATDEDETIRDAPVPWPPVSVRVCHLAAGAPTNLASPVAADHPATVATALADQLDALPEDPIGGCGDPDAHEQWVVLFANAAGDQVSVSVDAGRCPDVYDGSRDYVPDTALFARLTALSP